MRLFWMEIYKLLHKKVTRYAAIGIMLFLCLFAFSNIQGEETVVYGTYYKGIQAIKKNIEITKQYSGILTDEKINDIISTYGFPQKVERDFGYWRDGNFLNQFVTDHFSNGYIEGWNPGEYKIPTHTTLISDSELGKYAADMGKEIEFGYYKGWEYLEEYWQLGIVLAGIWLIVTITPLFVEEHQLRTSSIMFTTYHGKKQHIAAKILASFAISLVTYLSIILSGILFYGCSFGLDGGNMLYYFIDGGFNYNGRFSINQMYITYGAVLFVAMLMTTAISIWVSSWAKTSFSAVVCMLLIFVFPILPEFFGWGRLSTFFFYSMPLGHMMVDILTDVWAGPVFLQRLLEAVFIIGSVSSGWNRYRKIEV